MKYLHYWKGSLGVNPLAIAVHWEGSSQLWLYSLAASKGKGRTRWDLTSFLCSCLAPERVFSQAGRVTSVAVSDSSYYLALGLDSGCVAMYNMKTGKL